MIVDRKLAVVLGLTFVSPILARCGSSHPLADQAGSHSRRDNPSMNPGMTSQGVMNCDISFSNDIQPIFDARCTRCHNPDLFRGSLDLTADNSYANLVDQPTSDTCMAEVPDSVRVVPFDTQGSMLWLKTSPDDSRCGRPMPFGTDGLGVIAPDEFALIDAWIAQGAQNN